MKNLKLLFASVICLTSLLFTSCMSTNDNNHTYGIILATVHGSAASSVYFTDTNSNIYSPTNASSLVTSSGASITYTAGDIAYVYFYYSDDTQATKTSGSRSIVIEGYADVQKNDVNVVSVRGASNDTLKTDSIISVDGITVVHNSYSSGYSLIATTNFYFSKLHNTYLFYYQNDGFVTASVNSDPDTLKFVLGHNKQGDTGSSYSANSYPSLYYNAFKIDSPVMTAASQSNKDSIVVDLKARVWQSESDNSKGIWKHYYCKYSNRE